ncbi:MAG: magnesium/cobalt transporter CorA [Calothrix sp. MO_167.B42]|nr:magnesium/cobalt transporter CorA [Calothrix sp. MO_167.B42]
MFPIKRNLLKKREKNKEFYHQPITLPENIVVDKDSQISSICLIDYTETEFIHKSIEDPNEIIPYLERDSVSWIDIQGLGSADTLKQIGQIFDLHPLVLEDVVNVVERPKIEEYAAQLVIIARMVFPKMGDDGYHSEQVSFVLGKNYLLTFQEESKHDCFGRVRLRIRHNKGIIHKRKSDYLAYALLDAIIDNFFPLLEDYGERIEALEQEAIIHPNRQTLQNIYQIRREFLQLRRTIWPQRDAINSLIRDGSTLISNEVSIYLRDCYDHTVQVMDLVENYRELASSLMDVYLSAVSNKMNEIMKLLTVFSWIFFPLTFIAGIYGMNFKYMPGLNLRWGFWICIFVMVCIATGLILFFWQRGWLDNSSSIHID